jgi:hypothetical protein
MVVPCIMFWLLQLIERLELLERFEPVPKKGSSRSKRSNSSRRHGCFYLIHALGCALS